MSTDIHHGYSFSDDDDFTKFCHSYDSVTLLILIVFRILMPFVYYLVFKPSCIRHCCSFIEYILLLTVLFWCRIYSLDIIWWGSPLYCVILKWYDIGDLFCQPGVYFLAVCYWCCPDCISWFIPVMKFSVRRYSDTAVNYLTCSTNLHAEHPCRIPDMQSVILWCWSSCLDEVSTILIPNSR